MPDENDKKKPADPNDIYAQRTEKVFENFGFKKSPQEASQPQNISNASPGTTREIDLGALVHSDPNRNAPEDWQSHLGSPAIPKANQHLPNNPFFRQPQAGLLDPFIPHSGTNNLGYVEMNQDWYEKQQYVIVKKVERDYKKLFETEEEEKAIAICQQNLSTLVPMMPILVPPGYNWQYMDYIPHDLLTLAEQIAAKYNWDITSVIILMLFVLVASLGGRYKLAVNNEWHEAIVLHLAMVNGPNKIVNDLFKDLMAGLRSAENGLQEINADRIEDANIALNEKSKFHNEALRTKIRKSREILAEEFDNTDEYMRLLDEFSEGNIKKAKAFQKANRTNPKMPRLIMTDPTEMELRKTLHAQGGRISICSGESGLLSRLLKSHSGYRSYHLLTQSYNMEMSFLEANSSREHISITTPAVNIMSMTKPDIIEKLYQKEDLKTSGFLPCLQSIYTSTYMPSNRTSSQWEQYEVELKKFTLTVLSQVLLNFSQDHKAEIRLLSMTDEAREILFGFKNEFDGYIKAGYFMDMEAFVEKVSGTAIRLAAGIHAWSDSDVTKSPISASEMIAGIELAKILFQHTCYANDYKVKQFFNLVSRTMRVIITKPLQVFTASDISRSLNRVHVEELKPILMALQSGNCLAIIPGNRKDSLYVTNPAVFRWQVL